MSYWEQVGKSDEWYTPEWIFKRLNTIFDMDVAASPFGSDFVPALKRLTEGSLEVEWEGFIWMNPPYGGRNGLIPWMDKFVKHGNGICLIPDRTSAPTFQMFMGEMDLICFSNGKIKFINPEGEEGKSPSNGSVFGAIGQKGAEALMNAKLGLLFRGVN